MSTQAEKTARVFVTFIILLGLGVLGVFLWAFIELINWITSK